MHGEKFICRVCKSSSHIKLGETPTLPEYIWPSKFPQKPKESKLKIINCKSCGHYQLQNFTDAVIDGFYGVQSFVETTPEHHEEILADLVEAKLLPINELSTLIDFGGGINSILVSEKLHHLQRTCVDFRSDPHLGKQCIRFIAHDLNEPLDKVAPKSHFGFMLHTLEHLNNPIMGLVNLRNNLIDYAQGKAYLEVPNFEWYSHNLPYYTFFHQHLNIFTKTSLERLLFKVGLEVVTWLRQNEVLGVVVTKTSTRAGEAVVPPTSDSELKEIWHRVQNHHQNTEKKVAKFLSDKSAFAIGTAGGLSHLTFGWLKSHMQKATHVYDSDPRKLGHFFNGHLEVSSLSENPEPSLPIVSTSNAFSNSAAKIIPSQLILTI